MSWRTTFGELSAFRFPERPPCWELAAGLDSWLYGFGESERNALENPSPRISGCVRNQNVGFIFSKFPIAADSYSIGKCEW